MSSTPLPADDLRRALAIRDLTDPGHGRHALQLIIAGLAEALATDWQCRTRTVRRNPIVSLHDNYDHLGYAGDAVTRDARYTRYVDATHVLRSHSSAMVPGALRRLAEEAADGTARQRRPGSTVSTTRPIMSSRSSMSRRPSLIRHRSSWWGSPVCCQSMLSRR